MENPQVTWYILEQDTLTPYEEYYAGSYRPSDTLEVTMQVWNNRWGQESVLDVTNANVAVFFDTLEDSYLLNLCSIKIDDGEFLPLNIQTSRGRISLGKTLSGTNNIGSISSTGNYATVTLKFGPITDGIKNSLKNLFVDLEFNN